MSPVPDDGHDDELDDGLDASHARDDVLDELIHRVDLDGLVRLVDARCESRDWDGLRRVRDRARAAAATGRQLWPATTLASYRLALLAPAPWAAEAVTHIGRFTLGPLTEVVAQYHTWSDLAPHLDTGPTGRYVAHERSIRGDRIDEDDVERFAPVIEVPVALRDWEPHYPVATYHDDHGDFPTPPAPTVGPVTVLPTTPVEILDDPDVDASVRHLVEPWWVEGGGRVKTTCVQGDAHEALAALGLRRARFAALDAAEALAWLGWAGASGGAHGRRRGAAAGRDGAWWVLGALGDLHDHWPPTDAAVEDLLTDLRWWWWDADEPAVGWALRLSVEDTASRVAWAFDASDLG